MNDETQVEVIKRDIAPVVAKARAIVVRTAQEYEWAADFLKSIKSAQKKVADHFGPMKSAAHAAWKAVTSKEAETLAPLADAEQLVKSRMVEYSTAQERIRRAEEARLQAAANEAARKERERLEKEAAKLKTPELKEARLAQAEQVVAPVVKVAAATPTIQGQSIRKTWKAKITDPKKAVLAVMQWPDWAAYVKINEAEFNRLAARTKGAVEIDGIEWYEESTLASTSR